MMVALISFHLALGSVCSESGPAKVVEMWHAPVQPSLWDGICVHVRFETYTDSPLLQSFAFSDETTLSARTNLQPEGSGIFQEITGCEECARFKSDRWMQTFTQMGDVSGFQIAVCSGGTWTLSDVVLTKCGHESNQIALNVWLVDVGNRSLPAFAAVRANASSPQGIRYVSIVTLRYGDGYLWGIRGGGMTSVDGAYVYPPPQYSSNCEERNWTDAVCFFVVYAMDGAGNYAVTNVMNVTIGNPKIIYCPSSTYIRECFPIASLGILGVAFWRFRRRKHLLRVAVVDPFRIRRQG